MIEEVSGLGQEVLEPTLDIEKAPSMEPSHILACEIPSMNVNPHHYWQAQNFASILHAEFEDLKAKGDKDGMRQHFYILAKYYGRTIAILRQTLKKGHEQLINTALRNLIALHQPLHHMHDLAPTNVPFALTLNKKTRLKLIEDLIIKILSETSEAMPSGDIQLRVNKLHVLIDVSNDTIKDHLDRLMAEGYVVEKEMGVYTLTKKRYHTINVDRAGLEALLGDILYLEFLDAGFQGISSLINRRKQFKQFFNKFTGCSPHMADLFITTSVEILGTPSHAAELSPWTFSDLINSTYPRPYQYQAYAIFRGYGYQGQVIEAPTGSGKTMIGMMCIQDWLHTMSSGESILIVVPTINYQKQWFEELAIKSIGLKISSNSIFTGTPSGLKKEIKRTGTIPPITILTYSSLVKLGNQTDIELFIKHNNFQYLILDEVHKVADNIHSATARLARLLTVQLSKGLLRGLVGFSGTATAFRDRFTNLGLELVYILPAADLTAYGFVAPFTELGIPFAYSNRENDILKLISQYKNQIKKYIDLLGNERLSKCLAKIPEEVKIGICRDWLGMYRGYKDRTEAIAKRLQYWQQSRHLNLHDLAIPIIIQAAYGFSDKELVQTLLEDIAPLELKNKMSEFDEIVNSVHELRAQMKEIIYLSDLRQRLDAEGFGVEYQFENTDEIKALPREIAIKAFKDNLAKTILGLYLSLREFYYHVGEGRVDSIKAVIEAERKRRNIPGAIIFDRGKRIVYSNGEADYPGFAGVAGLFTDMLGDDRFDLMAVLSDEIYLSCNYTKDLPQQIVRFIKGSLMKETLCEAMFNIVTQDLALSADIEEALHVAFTNLVEDYMGKMSEVGGKRPKEFNRKVLARFRRKIKRFKIGAEEYDAIRSRTSINNHHIERLVIEFFDYAIVCKRFEQASLIKIRQANSQQQSFYIIKMATGDRKLLMYDLAARIMDSDNVPINIIIVSLWARTGWNVISPNVLIDATATRDITAWQQLRGRAMRAWASWDRDCSLLTMRLLGSTINELESIKKEYLDGILSDEELEQKDTTLKLEDSKARVILIDIIRKTHKRIFNQFIIIRTAEEIISEIDRVGTDLLSKDERKGLAALLMLTRNKVTHIYELLKTYGSTSQIRYHSLTKRWQRLETIARKHNHEYSVNPISGNLDTGEAHAPLIYTGNPKKNAPEQLENLLLKELKNLDRKVVPGWIKAATAGKS